MEFELYAYKLYSLRPKAHVLTFILLCGLGQFFIHGSNELFRSSCGCEKFLQRFSALHTIQFHTLPKQVRIAYL